MENSVLWQSLGSLNNLEHKHFSQWLQSPFFCRQPELSSLYAYLKSCLAKRFLPEGPAVQKACNATDDQGLRLAMSALLAQLEHFLAYQEKFALEPDTRVQVAAAYRKRALEKQFQRALKRAHQQWDAQPYRHSGYYEAKAAMEYEAYQFQSTGNRTEALNLQALMDATDLAFMAQKLRQACFALTHQTVFKADYQFGLLEGVLGYLQKHPNAQEIPVVALYHACYLFLTDPENEAQFHAFKQMLLNNAALLPPDEQRDLHLLAINYCIKKINQLQSNYFREALDLYQSALRADLLLENGVLSHFAYNNIVAIALKVHETDWTETFIHQYATFLEKKHRAGSFHLNLARVAYVKSDYRQALLHLQEADYKDLINNLIAKTLQIKIYYETGELDALEAQLQSMGAFLRRQRVIGYHKNNYQNIIRYTRKLMQLRPSDRKARAELATQIQSETPLTEKEWMLEMLEKNHK